MVSGRGSRLRFVRLRFVVTVRAVTVRAVTVRAVTVRAVSGRGLNGSLADCAKIIAACSDLLRAIHFIMQQSFAVERC